MLDAPRLYGIMAEFASPEALVAAAVRANQVGYRRLEAFSPFSIEGLPEVLGFRANRLPMITLIGGVLGGAGAYAMQWYSAVIDYPINSGGRPLNSWPAFIPPTFELTILGAAAAAFVGFLAFNRLPQLNHPVFNVAHFDTASRNRFFLCVNASDKTFDADAVTNFLRGLDPVRVAQVPLDDAA